MENKNNLALIFLGVLIVLIFLTKSKEQNNLPEKQKFVEVPIWEFTSIDTVKYSRDLTEQMLNNSTFDMTINRQLADIASTGATHVAVGTPYDQKYVPFLKRWVDSARRNGLNVWFRGNFSGWEKWFGFEKISREEHKKLLKEFILNNPELFENGDIFTSCPECENGGPGDPRQNGDSSGHRKFLIEEYNISNKAFESINKKVYSGFYSMNFDVARLIMDRDTTQKLGNLVVIDHYIKDPLQISEDAKLISEQSGGKVVLGEIGVPIPDIHGEMSEKEQSLWIEQALEQASKTPEIVGLNYWVNTGGSTKAWNDDGSARDVVATISQYFRSTKTISTH